MKAVLDRVILGVWIVIDTIMWTVAFALLVMLAIAVASCAAPTQQVVAPVVDAARPVEQVVCAEDNEPRIGMCALPPDVIDAPAPYKVPVARLNCVTLDGAQQACCVFIAQDDTRFLVCTSDCKQWGLVNVVEPDIEL